MLISTPAGASSSTPYLAVCADGFQLSTAVGVCTSLGFVVTPSDVLWWAIEYEDIASTSARSGDPSAEFGIRRLQCPSNATSGALCTYTQDGICTSESMLYIRCGAPTLPSTGWQFALGSVDSISPDPVDGTAVGRVLVRNAGSSSAGDWTHLCLAYGSEIDASTGKFLCEQMGFGRDPPFDIWRYGSCCHRLESNMGSLSCPAGTTSLSSCTYDAPATCQIIAYLNCEGSSNSQSPIPWGLDYEANLEFALMPSLQQYIGPPAQGGRTFGILGVRVQPGQPFLPYRSIGASIRVSDMFPYMCEWMGLQTPGQSAPEVWAPVPVTQGVRLSPITVDDCPSGSTSFDDCTFQNESASVSVGGTVYMSCSGGSEPLSIGDMGPLQVALQEGRDGQIGTGLAAGVLRTRRNEGDEWGYVCPTTFNFGAAQRVCRALGFGGGTRETVRFGGYKMYGGTAYGTPVLACGELEGSAPDVDDSDCVYELQEPYIDRCAGDERTWLDCGRLWYRSQQLEPRQQDYDPPLDAAADPRFSDIEFRFGAVHQSIRPYLSDEFVFRELEASVAGQEFGAVCGGFDSEVGEAICEGMGRSGFFLEEIEVEDTVDNPAIASVQCPSGVSRSSSQGMDVCSIRQSLGETPPSQQCQPAVAACRSLTFTFGYQPAAGPSYVVIPRRGHGAARAGVILTSIGAALGVLASMSSLQEGTPEAIRVACGHLAPFQALGSAVALAGVLAELTAAFSREIYDDEYRSAIVLGPVGMALFGLGVLASTLTVFTATVQDDQFVCGWRIRPGELDRGEGEDQDGDGASPGEAENRRQRRAEHGEEPDCCLYYMMCLCVIPASLPAAEACACLATPNIFAHCCRGPQIPVEATQSRDAFLSFLFRVGAIRAIIFELPVLLILTRILASVGGWYGLHAALGLGWTQVACTVARVAMWWRHSYPGSKVGRSVAFACDDYDDSDGAAQAGAIPCCASASGTVPARRNAPRNAVDVLVYRSAEANDGGVLPGTRRSGMPGQAEGQRRQAGVGQRHSRTGASAARMPTAPPAPIVAATAPPAIPAGVPSYPGGGQSPGGSTMVANPMGNRRLGGRGQPGDLQTQEDGLVAYKKKAAASAGASISMDGVAAYPGPLQVTAPTPYGSPSAGSSNPYGASVQQSSPYGPVGPAGVSPYGPGGTAPDATAGAWNAGRGYYGEAGYGGASAGGGSGARDDRGGSDGDGDGKSGLLV